MTPQQQTVTRYLEATGNTAAVNTADLVARVAGLRAGDQLPGRRPREEGHAAVHHRARALQVKLEQAQAAEAGAEGGAASRREAEFKRQAELIAQAGRRPRRSTTSALAKRDADRRPTLRAGPGQHPAGRRSTTTTPQVKAPFDGIVTARQVSVGDYVGGSGTPTVLATIVQLDPIYVNFNISEQDVLRVRAEIGAARLHAATTSRRYRSRSGCRPRAAIRTGHARLRRADRRPRRPARWRCAASSRIRTACCCPAISCACACRSSEQPDALLVPDVALGSDQGGRYVLVVNKDNVVEQRKVEIGQLVGEHAGDRQGPQAGRPRRRRRPAARDSRAEGRSAGCRPQPRRASGRQAAP